MIAANADATQGALPLGWFFGMVAAAGLILAVKITHDAIRESREARARTRADRWDERLDVYGEPELSATQPVVTSDSCRCPDCVGYGRALVAGVAPVRWTARDDRRVARYARRAGGA